MRQTLIFFSFLGLLSYLLSACSYTEKIKDGKTAYQRKQFSVAIPLLQKEFNKTKDSQLKAEQAYMLAESYQRTNDYQKAAEWYNKADDLRLGKDEALQLARMYQQLEQYDDATKAFQSAGRNFGDVNYFREQINACKKAKISIKEIYNSGYSLQSLAFNTKDNDFSAVLFRDSLLFASDRKESVGKTPYKWTGTAFFDFYMAHQSIIKDKTAAVSTVQRANLPFNKEFHQATPSFNADYTEMYFSQCGSNEKTAVDYCKIMRSEFKNGAWTSPEAQVLGESDYNYIHPHLISLSTGGKMLYFAANIKSGYGGYDLYSSLWLENEQKWATPRNLGNVINTKGNDVFPFMQADTLYFASNGQPTMGGLDIYRIERDLAGGRWKNLQQLPAPINSGGDDFGLIFLPNVENYRRDANDSLLFEVGLLSSNRIIPINPTNAARDLNHIEPKGGDDLYKFERRRQPPVLDTPKVVDTPITPTIAKAKVYLQGVVKAKGYKIANNPNSGLKDSVLLVGASVQISSQDTAYTVGVDTAAAFEANINPSLKYTAKASKEGYFANVADVDIPALLVNWDETHGDTTINIEIVLEQIFSGQEIVLENIYYDYNDDKIRADAQPTLNELADILSRNPQIRIQLASHTDCRGADKYNEALSQRRADSAVKYLQSKGIPAERLTAKGFGESRPSNDCKCATCTEDQHQANRRTTFMVLD
jgi:outer membrane protein OmpA-like peptidoglycan-associated protein